MTADDVDYLQRILERGLVQSPCLELGVGYSGPSNKELLQSNGIDYVGTDMHAGASVDHVVDFEQTGEAVRRSFPAGLRFGSAIVFNVLEHTFDPIRVLDNVFEMLRPGGTCVVLTPTVWPLHDYPYDCWRINPNFYEQYAQRHGLDLLGDTLEYVGKGRVRESVDAEGRYVLPRPGRTSAWRTYSRIVHRLFNTHGRHVFFPSHVATAVVMRKPLPAA